MPQPSDVHDAQLVDAVRAGDSGAFEQLYREHRAAAYNLGRQLARCSADVDDLVSVTFTKVLVALHEGRGPDSDTGFRAYLLTALRHTAYDKAKQDKPVVLTPDVTVAAPKATVVPFRDTAVARLERSLAAKAFSRLPHRWQTVLWHTEIKGRNPAEVAPLLGLTANGVAALALRAREGLRQAYLQQHVTADHADCRPTVHQFGRWLRGGLRKREHQAVCAHIDACRRCRALVAELVDVAGGLSRLAA